MYVGSMKDATWDSLGAKRMGTLSPLVSESFPEEVESDEIMPFV